MIKPPTRPMVNPNAVGLPLALAPNTDAINANAIIAKSICLIVNFKTCLPQVLSQCADFNTNSALTRQFCSSPSSQDYRKSSDNFPKNIRIQKLLDRNTSKTLAMSPGNSASRLILSPLNGWSNLIRKACNAWRSSNIESSPLRNNS